MKYSVTICARLIVYWWNRRPWREFQYRHILFCTTLYNY